MSVCRSRAANLAGLAFQFSISDGVMHSGARRNTFRVAFFLKLFVVVMILADAAFPVRVFLSLVIWMAARRFSGTGTRAEPAFAAFDVTALGDK